MNNGEGFVKKDHKFSKNSQEILNFWCTITCAFDTKQQQQKVQNNNTRGKENEKENE